MPAQVITHDDLLSFKEDLLIELKELFGGGLKQRKWLKSEDVRKMLNISPGTLQTFRIKEILPFTKVGGIIFYDYDDVVKVLDGNRTKSEK
ncbi:MAG: helix-turn-helix domain-containing protein [Chitinophagaceae bacterium]|nr:helix-turn-helix domain-containing protein [Chitinophagaceae bacterium]